MIDRARYDAWAKGARPLSSDAVQRIARLIVAHRREKDALARTRRTERRARRTA